MKKFIPGIVFGIFMTLVQLALGFAGKTEDTNAGKLVIGALISGVIAGALFGWIMNWFAKNKRTKQAATPTTLFGEAAVLESPANHFKGLEAVGGRLYLTQTKIIFKSHSFNIQNHELVIERSNIKNTSRYRSLGIVNNGLIIELNDSTKHKFVVNGTGEWVAKISA